MATGCNGGPTPVSALIHAQQWLQLGFSFNQMFPILESAGFVSTIILIEAR